MNHAASAYAKVAKETAPPRELEATLLLRPPPSCRPCTSCGRKSRPNSRTPCCIIASSGRCSSILVNRDDNHLPKPVRNNLVQLGLFVMNETFAAMTKPTLNQLKAMIKVNRGIAAGLRGRA